VKADVGNLDNFEPDSGNVTNSVSGTTKTSYKDFVVFFNVVQATIIGDESCNFLSIFDKLYSDTLTDSRVRLFGFNTDLLKNDSFSVGSTSEGVSLEGCTKMRFLVIF